MGLYFSSYDDVLKFEESKDNFEPDIMDLPVEVLVETLIFCPIKDLYRLRTVCTLFDKLILGSKHLAHQKFKEKFGYRIKNIKEVSCEFLHLMIKNNEKIRSWNEYNCASGSLLQVEGNRDFRKIKRSMFKVKLRGKGFLVFHSKQEKAVILQEFDSQRTYRKKSFCPEVTFNNRRYKCEANMFKFEKKNNLRECSLDLNTSDYKRETTEIKLLRKLYSKGKERTVECRFFMFSSEHENSKDSLLDNDRSKKIFRRFLRMKKNLGVVKMKKVIRRLAYEVSDPGKNKKIVFFNGVYNYMNAKEKKFAEKFRW